MPTSYAKNKIHIYNYVENNRDKINEINNRWIHKNLESHNEKRRKAYEFKSFFNLEKEWKNFRNIELF